MTKPLTIMTLPLAQCKYLNCKGLNVTICQHVTSLLKVLNCSLLNLMQQK